MPKLTPKRTFLLRYSDGVRTIAKRGVKIDVSEDEWKRLPTYFKEPYPVKKKSLSVN